MLLNNYHFLDKTISIKLPKEWTLNDKDSYVKKIKFPFGPYPTLDVYISCFDDPKINSEDKIKEYLLEGIETKNEILKIKSNTYVLKYEFVSDSENLLIWKILNLLKPRNFREVRLSLAWPNNPEANSMLKNVSNIMPDIIKNIDFNKDMTNFDDLAVLKYKIKNIRLKKHIFWQLLKIFLPERWSIYKDQKENYVNIEIDKEKKIFLFFEYFDVEKKASLKNNDKTIKEFIENITKDVSIQNSKLVKADTSNYIYKFYTIEKNQNDKISNHIWYRILVRIDKITISSFVFNYNLQNKNIGELYLDKIDELIKSSEII